MPCAVSIGTVPFEKIGRGMRVVSGGRLHAVRPVRYVKGLARNHSEHYHARILTPRQRIQSVRVLQRIFHVPTADKQRGGRGEEEGGHRNSATHKSKQYTCRPHSAAEQWTSQPNSAHHSTATP